MSAADAQQAVQSWLAMDSRPLGAQIGNQVSWVETFSDKQGPIYYVVHLNPSGSVIVSTDDLIEPILGFSSADYVDSSQENPLGSLVSQDAGNRMAEVRNLVKSSTLPERFINAQEKWQTLLTAFGQKYINACLPDERVSPLLDGKLGSPLTWSQSNIPCHQEGCADGTACYNYFTPPGEPSSSTNYPCGCTATAMAQLIRYHQYPTSEPNLGPFLIKYNDYSSGSPVLIERDEFLLGGTGSGGSYDWSKIPPSPGDSPGDNERREIGALTHDTGVAVGMFYDKSENGGSGAWPTATSLLQVFHYSNAIRALDNENGIVNVISGMINPNLDAGLPLILSIYSSTESDLSHTILCDGYAKSSGTWYHHLNMGWAGAWNYWYNLPDIDTNPPSGPFNCISCCIYNIFPTGSGEIISGRVTDISGNPMKDVTVGLEGVTSYSTSTITNNRGIYFFVKVPSSETFTVSASCAGYSFASRQRTVQTGNSINSPMNPGNLWGEPDNLDFVGTPIPGPVFSPGSSTVSGPISVTITASGGASIYYTTDGTAPDSSPFAWSSPVTVQVSNTTTIKAQAVLPSGEASLVSQATYIFSEDSSDAPVVRTEAASSIISNGAFLNATITDNGGSAIVERRFDWGTTPDGNWSHWTRDVSVAGNFFTYYLIDLAPDASYYFRSWAKNSASPTWGVGSIMSFRTPPAGVSVVATPSFLPNGGTFTDSVSVQISCATSGATIRYTINGSDPTESSSIYSGPITRTATTTLKARAFKNGMTQSGVASATYTIQDSPDPVYEISGEVLFENAPLPVPVTLTATPAVPGTPVILNNEDDYLIRVPAGWTGHITPTATGYKFSPTRRNFDDMEDHQDNEDFQASIEAPDSAHATIYIQPQAAIDLGAGWIYYWYKDGTIGGWLSNWHASGEETWFSQGDEYRFSFKDIPGWNTPENQILFPVPGQSYTLTAIYVRQEGSISVAIEPAEAIAGGAKWRVAGGAWRNSGYTESNLPIGAATIEFQAVGGWTTPDNREVEILQDVTSPVFQEYIAAPLAGQPTISAIEPSTGPLGGGTQITVHGTNFVEPVSVLVDGVEASGATWISNDEVIAITPQHDTINTVPVTVETAGQAVTQPNGFTYVAPRGQGLELVSQIGGTVAAVAVFGDYAFVGMGSGFHVFNVSSPSSPVHITRLPLPSIINDLTMAGNYVVAAIADTGLAVIDVSDPTAPALSGAIDLQSTGVSVAVIGAMAAVALDSGPLALVDISAPRNPQVLGRYTADGEGKGIDLAISGDAMFAYLTIQGSGLQILDVTDPAHPTAKGLYPIMPTGTEKIGRVAVSGSMVVTCYQQGAAYVLNVTDPNAPTLYSRLTKCTQSEDVRIADNYACLLNSGRVEQFDMSDPAAPIWTGQSSNVSISTISGSTRLAISNGRAYVAGDEAFAIVNISTPSPFTTLTTLNPELGYTRSVTVSGESAFVSQSNEGVTILDVANPVNPQVISQVGDGDQTFGNAVAGNLLYAANGTAGLKTYNISDLESPQLLSTYTDGGNMLGASCVTLLGSSPIVGGCNPQFHSSFHVVNMSNPSTPVTMGSSEVSPTDNWASALAVSDSMIYIGSGSTLYIYTSSRVFQASIAFDGAVNDLIVAGTKAYVVDTVSLKVINVSDPLAPQVIGSYETPDMKNMLGIVKDEQYFYVAGAETGVRVLEATGDNSFNEVAFYDTAGAALKVSISGDLVYVADGVNGLVLLRLKDLKAPSITITYPVLAADYNAISDTINLGGVASDDRGLDKITWSNDRSGSGETTATENWTVSKIPLQAGSNVLTVTAEDTADNTASDTISVTWLPPDTCAPVLTLLGENPVDTAFDGVYEDAGATAMDDVDGNLTADIVVGGLPVDSDTLGVHVVTYDVSDGAGNTATRITRTVNVVDMTPPVILILGDNPAGVEAGEAYEDPGATANDNVEGDVTSGITSDSDMNTMMPGAYKVTYHVTDAAGNAAEATRIVLVTDTTSPQIVIHGDNPVTVEAGFPYNDMGATATDSVDGDLTYLLVASGLPVDTGVLAASSVTYNVSDLSGNASPEAVRSVIVADTIPPVVTLNDGCILTVPLDDTFSDPGATAMDSFEGDVSGSVTIEGLLDTSIAGVYTLIYTASDQSGNTGNAGRTVVVGDDVPPLLVVTIPEDSPITIPEDSIDFSGTALDAGEPQSGLAQVIYNLNGGEWTTAFGTSNWSASADLMPGTNIIEVGAVDRAGNISELVARWTMCSSSGFGEA